jgi:hypothetical protein
LLLLILLVSSAISFNAVGGLTQQSTSSQEQIFNGIKATAEQPAESGSAIIKPTVFRYVVNEKNANEKNLEYNLGGVRPGALEGSADDPYLIPVEQQIQVEAIRKLLKREAPNESFWQPILAQLEQIVRATISDIESTADKADLQRKLDARKEQFDAELGKLDDAIKLHAQSKGYKARRVGRVLASDTFLVTVVKTPDNGRIQVLPWAKYVLCNTLKKCGNSWPWRELVSESESMIGEYYYQAEWPDGKRNEGKIDVRNNTTITFKPR